MRTCLLLRSKYHSGQIDLNGTQVTPGQLRTSLASLKEDGVVLWYDRESGNERRSAETEKVIEIIADAHGLDVEPAGLF